MPSHNGDWYQEKKRNIVDKLNDLDLDTDIEEVVIKAKRTRPKSASMAIPAVKKRQL